MKGIFQLVEISLLLIIIRGNIWDNIFGAATAPKLILPPNFKADLYINGSVFEYTFNVSYNHHGTHVKLIGTLKSNNITLHIIQMLFRFNESKLILHESGKNSCKISVLPNIIFSEFNTTSLSSLIKIISFYKGINTDGLHVFEIFHVDLFKIIKERIQAFLYIEKDNTIKSLEIRVDWIPHIWDVESVVEISQDDEKEFSINSINNCKNENLMENYDFSKIKFSSLFLQIEKIFETFFPF